MKQVISALERQIRIEEGRTAKREMMLCNASAIVFTEDLPFANPSYIEELKQAVVILSGHMLVSDAAKESNVRSVNVDEVCCGNCRYYFAHLKNQHNPALGYGICQDKPNANNNSVNANHFCISFEKKAIR